MEKTNEENRKIDNGVARLIASGINDSNLNNVDKKDYKTNNRVSKLAADRTNGSVLGKINKKDCRINDWTSNDNSYKANKANIKTAIITHQLNETIMLSCLLIYIYKPK